LNLWGTGPTDVWACGLAGLVMHFDGSKWTRQVVNSKEVLWSVWTDAPNDAWVVGNMPFALHFDGSSWAP
jgi:hypothetical protein